MNKRSRLKKTKNSRVRKNRRKKRVRIREPKCKCCYYNASLRKCFGDSSVRCRDTAIRSDDSGTESVVNSLGDPDTSVPSLSSYNSYPSLEHEPLVRMKY